MAIQLFSNNAISAITDPLLTAETSMSITTGDGALFQAPTGGNYEVLMLQDPADSSSFEIVYSTARTSDGFTITRAQEGTSAADWPIGTLVIGGITKNTLETLPRYDDYYHTLYITGTPVIRKDEAQAASGTDYWIYFGGAEVVVMSEVINLKTTMDYAALITLQTGVKFFPNECGVIITSANTVTVQPFISYGTGGDTTALAASAQTVGLTAAGHRGRITTLSDYGGQTGVSASVKTGATATTMQGRFYFKGLLIENE